MPIGVWAARMLEWVSLEMSLSNQGTLPPQSNLHLLEKRRPDVNPGPMTPPSPLGANTRTPMRPPRTAVRPHCPCRSGLLKFVCHIVNGSHKMNEFNPPAPWTVETFEKHNLPLRAAIAALKGEAPKRLFLYGDAKVPLVAVKPQPRKKK